MDSYISAIYTTVHKPYPRAPLHGIYIHVMGLFLLQKQFIRRSISLSYKEAIELINLTGDSWTALEEKSGTNNLLEL